jgi:hypothetical protein
LADRAETQIQEEPEMEPQDVALQISVMQEAEVVLVLQGLA